METGILDHPWRPSGHQHNIRLIRKRRSAMVERPPASQRRQKRRRRRQNQSRK